MAKKIQARVAFGPRINYSDPMTQEEIIDNIIAATNQSRGSVLAVLDTQLKNGLRHGRIVQLPNGTHFKPTGKKDGSVEVDVRVNPGLVSKVNSSFRGKWVNGNNIGKSEDEIIALWNRTHPEDPVVP